MEDSMQTNEKDKHNGTRTPPPHPRERESVNPGSAVTGDTAAPVSAATAPATAATDDAKTRAKRKWLVVAKKDGTITEFDSKLLATRWLNTDPTAPPYGEFEMIIGNRVPLRQTVSLG
jgi:hypothetical protein